MNNHLVNMFYASPTELAEEAAATSTPQTALRRGRPFAGLALGVFTDMSSREIDLTEMSVDEIAANTMAAVAAAQVKKMPGLPIDARRHDKGEAAGWIVHALAGTSNDGKGGEVPVVILTADWTSLGVELISSRQQVNFSPTFDMQKRVIRGGSLTNWPASVNDAGIPLFDALELQQHQDTADPAGPAQLDAPGDEQEQHSEENTTMAIEMTDELRQAILESVREAIPDVVRELQSGMNQTQAAPDASVDDTQPPAKQEHKKPLFDLAQIAEAMGLSGDAAAGLQVNHLDELATIYQTQAKLQWQRRMANMRRENAMVELAAKVTGGTMDFPRGIPVDEQVLKAELMKLPADSVEFWQQLLTDIVKNGLTDYGELGHGRRMRGNRQLPAAYLEAIRAGELTVNDLSNPIIAPDLGDIDQYDLTGL